MGSKVLSNDQIVDILSLSKDAVAVYAGSNFVIQMATLGMLNFWGKDRQVIGMPLKEALFADHADLYLNTLNDIWSSGKSEFNIPVRVNVDGTLKWFEFNYLVIIDKENGITSIVHKVTYLTDDDLLKEVSQQPGQQVIYEQITAINEEVQAGNDELLSTQRNSETLNSELDSRIKTRTEEIWTAKSEAEHQSDRIKQFFMQAPAGICVLDGPDFVFELVNPLYQQFLPGRELLGKPVLEVIPELGGTPIEDTLKQVYSTGKTFEGNELLVPLARKPDGLVENRYFNFIYQARLNQSKSIDGILVFAIEVTDTVLNRQKIEQNEASFRNLVMTSHYGLMILRGREMRIEVANQQIANLWQKDLAQITGKTLLEVLPEIKDQPFPELLENVYNTGLPYSQDEEELLLHTEAGTVIKYVSFHYDAMRDTQGNVSGIIVACQDITEQIKSKQLLLESYTKEQIVNEELASTNEELAAINEEFVSTNEELLATQRNLQEMVSHFEESEARLRSLVDSAPFPIGVYQGREMKIILANQSIIDIWGKGNDVVGKLYSEILPELENQEIFNQLDSVYTTGVPFHARNTRVDLLIDGKTVTFYFNYSFTPLKNAQGNIYGVMNTAADVTDLNQAKKKVEQNEKNLHNMILQAPVAMCILIGPGHVIEVANPLMIELWGKPAENVINKPVFEALPDAREQGLEQLMANVYEKGETFHANEMPVSLIRHGKLEVVYQNFVYQPYKDTNGTILGVIAITIDITPQVLARKALEESEAELIETKKRLELELEAGKQIQKQKDGFIGIASHELKTPLTTLSAIIQVANSKLKNHHDEFLSGAMEKAGIQVKKMSSMINGFLNISRLESGKIIIEKEKFDLSLLVKEVVEEIKLTTTTHQIDFDCSDAIVVSADRSKISSVISNLVSNAVKYSPKQELVKIKCRVIENDVVVSVRDEGLGIGEADINKIFDRYYRVHSEGTQHISGFGIGLYLSADIIKRHGGTIWVESKKERGSTFYFSLPLS